MGRVLRNLNYPIKMRLPLGVFFFRYGVDFDNQTYKKAP